ncbi:MAG: GNAT family N-acetyltransferase [Chloroflexota bacterium]|nr:GNAT family N-acetyltransferase [Chloroflexota bacterium]
MMEIRRYRDSDHDAVWDLHNIALNEVGAHAGNGPWDNDLHRIEAEYIEAGGEFYVGLIDGRIVAMGALKRLTETEAEICRMRVHPDLQRRGFGTRILSKLEERARELNFQTLTLDTTTGQVAAIRMYTKAGYVEVARGRKLGFEVIAFEKHL